PYSRGLAGRYPLNRSSSDELALFDFAEFFKPGGTVENFYLEFIQPFVDRKGSWSNKVVDDYSIGFSAAALQQVRRALSIKEVYFQGGAETPTVSLELRPVSMNEKDARFILELGDERLIYNHGPRFWKSITWPGEGENKRVRVIFESLDNRTYDRTFVG